MYYVSTLGSSPKFTRLVSKDSASRKKNRLELVLAYVQANREREQANTDVDIGAGVVHRFES
jgi:hypothetical protein